MRAGSAGVLLAAALAAPALALSPRPALRPTSVLSLAAAADAPAAAAAPDGPAFASDGPAFAPSAEDLLQPTDIQLDWYRVVFFALNPAAFLPLPLLACLLRRRVLGPAFACDLAALRLGALWSAPMLALSLLPLERLPGLAAIAEVSRAARVITLWALGCRWRPLSGVAAAALISASAGVCEELAFRGTLQPTLQALLAHAGAPAAAAAAAACAAQALVFGALHSYTNSSVYFIATTVAGLAFGAAFAATGNLAVPVVMHFLQDLISFAVCHWDVAKRGSEADQRALLWDESPIARGLRLMVGGVREVADEEPPAPGAALGA